MNANEIFDNHCAQADAEFWWLRADIAYAEMNAATDPLAFIWARDRYRRYLWNSIIDYPKPPLAAIWMPEGYCSYDE